MQEDIGKYGEGIVGSHARLLLSEVRRLQRLKPEEQPNEEALFKEGAAAMAFQEVQAQLQLAKDVYETVFDATEGFEVDAIGADLAYLLGAILRGTHCAWPVSRPFVKLLQKHYAAEHSLWRYVILDEAENAKRSRCKE